MYYPDLTQYSYPNPVAPEQDWGVFSPEEIAEIQLAEPPVLNVGWLDMSQPFTQGDTSQAFQEKLLAFYFGKYTVRHYWGYHQCQFCEKPTFSIEIRRGNQTASLGNGEIRVIGSKAVYAAPTLIYHYIVAHQYQPPAEFIDAVLTCQPESEAYKALIAKTGY